MGATTVVNAARATTGVATQAIKTGGIDSFSSFIKRADSAQAGIDSAINRASTFPDLPSGELLALQARIYRSSLELDLASKMVEKVSGGIKQTMNTNG